MLRDFCDGSGIKEHNLFSRQAKALQIFFYYDDVEVVNPIGSHRKVHKLGMDSLLIHACTGFSQYFFVGIFYFMLGNLSPKYRSRYSSINLLAICKRKVMTKYSMSSVLRPIIEDLQLLVRNGVCCSVAIFVMYIQEQGYEFDVGGEFIRYYGTVAAVSADNPASNALGGFKESTAAVHYCRQCMADCSEALSEVYYHPFTVTKRFMSPPPHSISTVDLTYLATWII